MKVPLYLLTIFLGVVLAVHLSMNGKVGSVLNNARVGNALFWCIGAAAAVIIGFTGWQAGALQPLKDVHPLLLTAGALGASAVLSNPSILGLGDAGDPPTSRKTRPPDSLLTGALDRRGATLGSRV